jgi:sirohydrochlorin cobaltochelatase
MKKGQRPLYLITIIGILIFAATYNLEAMLKTRTLKKDPAIVIAAFGTTTKAMITFDFFEDQLREELPDKYKNLRIEWAFTSEIVRERANEQFKKAGINKQFKSLAQIVAELEDEGYRKIVVQPLHIFPGIEYENVLKMVEGLEKSFKDFGLRIKVGTPLLTHWEDLEHTVVALKNELILPSEGCNILVAHGTGETMNGANITYLGLERVVNVYYENVWIGSVEGIQTRTEALKRAKQCNGRKIKFIPFMFVAGDHIMNDIMRQEPNEEGELSWALEMQKAGFEVDISMVRYRGKEYYKGLGFYPEINRVFIKSIVRILNRFEI